jgi:hypothetical protein
MIQQSCCKTLTTDGIIGILDVELFRLNILGRRFIRKHSIELDRVKLKVM